MCYFQTIYEKSSELSKVVAQDVTDLTGALVEDSVETYSAFSEATRSTIEQVILIIWQSDPPEKE